MKGFREIVIPSNYQLSELTNRVENVIDFKYKKKIGTIEIEKKFYGDKVNERKFKLWRTPDIKLGRLFDIGFTNHFFVEISNENLILMLSRNWTTRIIIYILISAITLIFVEVLAWKHWVAIASILIAFVFHHIISYLNDESVKEDFQKIAGYRK